MALIFGDMISHMATTGNMLEQIASHCANDQDGQLIGFCEVRFYLFCQCIDGLKNVYFKTTLNKEEQTTTHIIKTPQPTCWCLVRKVSGVDSAEVEEVIFVLHNVILAKRLPPLMEMLESVASMTCFKKSAVIHMI